MSGPRPTLGRVSLVVFFTANCAIGARAPDSPEEFRDNCAPILIPLRRLVDRYPSLEVTVVSRTFGHFLNIVDSMSPAREAELTYQALVGFGIKRVPVAMYDMPFVRLPDPDGRIMERGDDDTNAAVYGGVAYGAWATNNTPDFRTPFNFLLQGVAYLVDEHGIVVYSEAMGRASFDKLDQFIKVLLERNHTVP